MSDQQPTKKQKLGQDITEYVKELEDQFKYQPTKDKLRSILAMEDYRSCLPFSKYEEKNKVDNYWCKIPLTDLDIHIKNSGHVTIVAKKDNNGSTDKFVQPLWITTPSCPLQFANLFPFGDFKTEEDLPHLTYPEYAVTVPKRASYIMSTTEIDEKFGDAQEYGYKYSTEVRAFHLMACCHILKCCELVVDQKSLETFFIDPTHNKIRAWHDLLVSIITEELPEEVKQSKDIRLKRVEILKALYQKRCTLPVTYKTETKNFTKTLVRGSAKLKISTKVIWPAKDDKKKNKEPTAINFKKMGLEGVDIPEAFMKEFQQGATYNELIARVANSPEFIIKGKDLEVVKKGSIISANVCFNAYPYKSNDKWHLGSSALFDNKAWHVVYTPRNREVTKPHDPNAYSMYQVEDNSVMDYTSHLFNHGNIDDKPEIIADESTQVDDQ